MFGRFKERKPCARPRWRYTGGDYRDLLGTGDRYVADERRPGTVRRGVVNILFNVGIERESREKAEDETSERERSSWDCGADMS